MWIPPDNIPQEMGIAPGEVSDFVSAMSMANGISLSNPQVTGNENLDGKDCLMVEYVSGELTVKATASIDLDEYEFSTSKTATGYILGPLVIF